MLQCSSTAAAAEIKDEHWYVADQPQAPGKLQLTLPCRVVMLCQHVIGMLHDVCVIWALPASLIYLHGLLVSAKPPCC